VPTRDLVNDRGMMGDGIIELKKIRGLLETAGYTGHVEVEIFSQAWWMRPADELIDTCVERYRTVV
jgi:sugar phosphate isomerase/epimerase